MELNEAFLDTLVKTNPLFEHAVNTGVNTFGHWKVHTLGDIGPDRSGCAAVISTRESKKTDRPVLPDDGKSILITVGPESVGLITADTEDELSNKISYTFGAH